MVFKNPQPFSHQRAAFERFKDFEYAALLMEAGTGKTRVVLDNAAYLYEKKKIDSLIVIAPNSVHMNWISQVDHWLPTEIPRAAYYYRASAKQKEQDAFDWVVTQKDKLRILTFNIETMSTDTGADMVKRLLDRNCKAPMLVVDESQRIKTPSSKRTKRTITLQRYSAYRRILSGTPVTQGLHDLYSQMKFLHWSILGCKSYAEFKATYCIMGGFECRQITGYRQVDRLQRLIAPYSFEANKRECIDLPPETFVTREVPLSPEQRRLYKQMKEEFIAELDNGKVVEAPLALTRVTRLLQIISGHIDNVMLPCPRIAECVELVNEARRGKVIIWTSYVPDVLRLSEALRAEGIDHILYYGGNAGTRSEELVRWRTDPKCQVMLGTPQCGGVGLDLIEADTEIFYSHGWNLEHRIQALARVMRPGQVNAVTYYDLVTPGTLEIRLMRMVQKKDDCAALFRDLSSIRALIASEEI